MNNLYKQIQSLEENITARKNLSRLQYQQAVDKLQHNITTPQAFGMAFLAGLLLTKRRKPQTTQTNKASASKPTKVNRILPALTNMFYLSSEFSGLISIANYAKKVFSKMLKSFNENSNSHTLH